MVVEANQAGSQASGDEERLATAMRAALAHVAETTDHLAETLEAAGVDQEARESSRYNLRVLDHRLPDATLGDVLLACEAYASVTGPAALATGDLERAFDGARHPLQSLLALEPMGNTRRTRRRLTGAPITAGGQAAAFRSALSERVVRAALEELIGAFTALLALEGGESKKRWSLLPIGQRFAVPGTVLASAIALIVFLLTSIAFATGQVAISPNGLDVPAISGKWGGVVTATPNGHAPAFTSTATPHPRQSATATPGANPTATALPKPTATATPISNPTATPSGTPTLTLSTTTVAPCFGAPDSFALTYTGGQSPINWSANWSDQTNLALSPSSGTLQPGGSVSVTVTLVNDVNTTGQIRISASDGLPDHDVTYDSTNC